MEHYVKKGPQIGIRRGQGWENESEQGAKGENVKGAGSQDPP